MEGLVSCAQTGNDAGGTRVVRQPPDSARLTAANRQSRKRTLNFAVFISAHRRIETSPPPGCLGSKGFHKLVGLGRCTDKGTVWSHPPHPRGILGGYRAGGCEGRTDRGPNRRVSVVTGVVCMS